MPIINQRKPRRLRKYPRHIMQIKSSVSEQFDGGSANVAYTNADYNVSDLNILVVNATTPSNMRSPFTHTDCIKYSNNTIDSDNTNYNNCIHVSGSGVTVEIDATIVLQFGATHDGYTGVQRYDDHAAVTGSAAIVYSDDVRQSSHGNATRYYGTEVAYGYWDARYPNAFLGQTTDLDEQLPQSGRYQTLHLKHVRTTTTDDTWFWLRVANYGKLGEFDGPGFSPGNLPTLTLKSAQMTIRNV